MKQSIAALVIAACIYAAGMTALAVDFNMLSCCPGENTATQARFVWHSDSSSCLLFCAKASSPENVYTILPYARQNKPVAFRSADVAYYKYEAQISDLEPDTEYLYWVEAGSDASARQKFKTAGTSGSFNFLWMSDVHAHPDNPGKMTTVELLRQDAEAQTASSGGIDLVLFSGDAVKYGSRYDNWQQWNGSPAVTNYMFAMIPGNKEYYYTGSSTFYDYYWYLAVKNNPPNGPGTTEQEGCYWFLRDSVLFVGIDSLIHKGSRMARYGDKTNVLRDQTNWFDRVVSEQKSKKSFRYLVVVQHDPWFVYAASKDSFDKSRGNYDTWRHVFDKHKVDLALSGDEHNYIRTKPLRGDAANSDGTIYMVAGQIEESNYSATITTSISDYGNANATKYFDCMGATDASCGAAWIEVRPDSLKVTEFWDKYQSPNYKKYDSVTITPKDRGFVYDPSGGTTGGDATPHTRYRFAVDAPRSDTFCMQLSEIQLLDENGSRISSGYTLAYDSTTKDSYGDIFGSDETPECAVDGDTSTKWLDWRAGLNQSAATRSVVWLDFCFANPTAVYGYRWYTANDAPGRTPVSWTFSASDDGGATWTVLDKVEDYDTTTDYNALAYSKRIETPQPPAPGGVHGKWLGGNGGNRFSVAANWDDGEVPGAGDALDFSSVTSATTIVKADDSDFTVSAKIGNREVATLRFDTTGRDGLGHTISLTGGIYREGKVFVEGTGTVACGYVQSDSSNPFTVTDTATLALLSGSKIGTGGVTVNSGAALSLSGTGTATMGGTLTLQGGSRIVVGAAGAGRPPYLTAKGVSLAGNSITVEIPSQAVGTFTVLTRTDGSFSDTDLAKLSLSVVSPDASCVSSLVLADGGKSIAVLTVAAWPANWNGGHAASTAMQTAFTAWAATPGNDTTAARAEGAFLLGLDLADYTEDMKIVSVALHGNKFTIDTNMDLTKVRGRLYVLVADSPADIVKSGTKITGTVADITKLVNIDVSAPAKFFKIGIDYAAVGGD